jgi:hypothetical protein
MPEARRIPRTPQTVAHPASLMAGIWMAVVIRRKVGANWAIIS